MNIAEFISKKLKDFMIEYNIVNIPEDILLVECANQTIVVMTKCMLKAKKFTKYLWRKWWQL